jgi:hypothetical protein
MSAAHPTRFVVTIFGSSQARPGSPAYLEAYELGRAIAAEGWMLCNGGYGGTMEAAAKGAAALEGETIGVICSAFRGRGGGNRFTRNRIETPDLLARLQTLAELGDAFVVLPGGTGTALELFLVWELSRKGMFASAKPIVLLGDHWQTAIECAAAKRPLASVPEIAPDVPGIIERLRRFRSRAKSEGTPRRSEARRVREES